MFSDGLFPGPFRNAFQTQEQTIQFPGDAGTILHRPLQALRTTHIFVDQLLSPKIKLPHPNPLEALCFRGSFFPRQIGGKTGLQRTLHLQQDGRALLRGHLLQLALTFGQAIQHSL